MALTHGNGTIARYCQHPRFIIYYRSIQYPILFVRLP
jgi:hypothetical protein